jgi:UDP-N-acetylmuramoylalanine--D-glutamate ligase
MRRSDLEGQRVAIWGPGKEGLAAADFIQGVPFVFLDEAEGPAEIGGHSVQHGITQIRAVLSTCDVLVKSPGVSLYRSELVEFRERGGIVTSLLNLWLAEPSKAKRIGVTGTKGKSTTASLLAHALARLGKSVQLVGNIGVPVTEATEADYHILELSSYQCADIEGKLDVALVSNLYPEHLDWHGSEAAYYRDKANLLSAGATKLISAQAAATGVILPEDVSVFDPDRVIETNNPYLRRPHNQKNLAAVQAVLDVLGLNLPEMDDFHGLPHRQQELGEKAGVLYVNDSISTTPQSAIAALEVYAHRPVTLIAGGHDRGVDYAPLVNYLKSHEVAGVVCMGPSGERIHDGLSGMKNLFMARNMSEAMALARDMTPEGGVILLSPAAPSYGLFANFEERGRVFSQEAGL